MHTRERRMVHTCRPDAHKRARLAYTAHVTFNTHMAHSANMAAQRTRGSATNAWHTTWLGSRRGYTAVTATGRAPRALKSCRTLSSKSGKSAQVNVHGTHERTLTDKHSSTRTHARTHAHTHACAHTNTCRHTRAHAEGAQACVRACVRACARVQASGTCRSPPCDRWRRTRCAAL
jgi:hypothetical protein